MIVEIRGVSFRGLGAELMISSIQEHVLSRAPNAEFALMPIGSYQERRKRNFLTKLPPFRLGRASLSAALMSSAFRKTLGVVANEDIDVILDASGFAYSDQWGAYGATELLRLCNWRRRQKPRQKIVLLPQAFGPFREPKTRGIFAQAFDGVDHIFARDQESLEHLQQLGPSLASRVTTAPDFTGGVHDHAIDGTANQTDPIACISPNVRMLDKLSHENGQAYIRLLIDCIHSINRAQLTPVIVTYMQSGDEAFVNILRSQSSIDVEHKEFTDPHTARDFISRSRLLFGSRFHFLTTAIGGGVPVIGCGWSHKYLQLFNSHGINEFLLRPDAITSVVSEAFQRLIDPDVRRATLENIANRARADRAATRSMWQRVDELVNWPAM